MDLEKVSCLLCSALEGGSNYWYLITEKVAPKEFKFRMDKDEIFKHIDYPLNEGGYIMIGDIEDPSIDPVKLDLESIAKGLEIMKKEHPRMHNQWVTGDDDADTGDVFLQCCLFGKVIYC